MEYTLRDFKTDIKEVRKTYYKLRKPDSLGPAIVHLRIGYGLASIPYLMRVYRLKLYIEPMLSH